MLVRFKLPQWNTINQQTYCHTVIRGRVALNYAYMLLAIVIAIGLASIVGCQSTEKEAEGNKGFDVASRERKAEAIRLERQARSLRDHAATQRKLAAQSEEKIEEYKTKLSKLDKSTPVGKADVKFYKGLIDQRRKEIENAERLANNFEEDASKKEALAKDYRREANALRSGKVPY